MKKLVIFYFDGTLIDTLEDLKNAVNHALIAQNLPKKSKEHIRISIGNGVNKLVARCLENGEENPIYLTVLNDFRKYYSEHSLDNTFPYPGIDKVLKDLKENNYLLAVCTNKVDSIAKDIMNKYFPNIFDYIQGDVDFLKKKPAKDMVEHILNKLNITKEECVYVGDTNVDEETALNSGVDYIIVNYGYRTIEELKRQCPTARISSMSDLVNNIKRLG